ncbi:MAG: polysaccharide deacetylase family protein [Pseudomonadota bacterium]
MSRPAVFRVWAALILMLLFQQFPASAAPPADNGAVVLLYHRFGEDSLPSTNVRLEQFEAQLAELAAGQYQVMALPDILAALAEDRPLPERTVGISIDDAFLSVYEEAWPRLRAAGFPFTLFVATEPLDRRLPNYMSWDQLREMQADDLVTLGGHSVTHGHMVEQQTIQNIQEIESANLRFRDELGRQPALFAYPFGEYDLTLRELVVASGFSAAFGQQSGAIARTSDRFALPRFPINEAYGGLERFRLIANALPLPVEQMVPADPVLGLEDNPPAFGFTVLSEIGNLDRLACYYQGDPLVWNRLVGRRIEVQVTHALPPGRSRINCTLPGPNGRWRWLGRQFYVPED